MALTFSVFSIVQASLLTIVNSGPLYCYNCDNIAHPKECDNLMVCSPNEVACYAQYNPNTQKFRYGCVQDCANIVAQPVGRSIDHFSHQNRSARSTDPCCKRDLCNRNLLPDVNGVTTVSPGSTCKDKLSVCANYGKFVCEPIRAVWAYANCRSFCGMCEPPVDPKCKDGFTNCKDYGTVICTTQKAWAQTWCPHFCNFCHSTVGGTGGGGGDPCSSYTTLNDPLRSVTNSPALNANLICDRLIDEKWYKFQHGEMPTRCVTPYHCGTHIPLWLNGAYPTPVEGVVSRQICADANHYDTDCCDVKWNIDVKNCGSYLVYNLKRSQGCDFAYCFNSSVIIQAG